MRFEVLLTGPARSYLGRLDRPTRDRFDRKFEELANDLLDPRQSKPLAGTDPLRAARVGAWRIILEVDREARVITVHDIAPRGQVSRRL